MIAFFQTLFKTTQIIKNANVDDITSLIQQKLTINTTTNEQDTLNYPVEFLNSLEPPGMASYRLNLKVSLPSYFFEISIHQNLAMERDIW